MKATIPWVMSNAMFLHPGEYCKMQEPAEKRNRSKSPSTARTARSSGRSLTANFSDSYSRVNTRMLKICAAVWGRSLFDNGAALVGVAEPTQLSTRAAGPGDAVHRHDGASYIEGRHDALSREPLRRLFPVASALSAVYRRCAIERAKSLGYGRVRSTELCVSVIRFACSLADLLKSVSNHTRPRADVRPGLPASVLNAPL